MTQHNISHLVNSSSVPHAFLAIERNPHGVYLIRRILLREKTLCLMILLNVPFLRESNIESLSLLLNSPGANKCVQHFQRMSVSEVGS